MQTLSEVPTLYIVATPIGNLEDITLRALRVLRSVSTIACEDTRNTLNLLRHFEIVGKSLLSYHNFNERSCTEKILSLLESGESVALVSDAGTPGISDPGFYVVREAWKRGFNVSPVAGASALAAAVSASPLPINRFHFEGFLPQKKGRQTRLKFLSALETTIILYESPHRFLKLLAELQAYLGDRTITVARELTKLHEEFQTGKLSEIILKFSTRKILGEFVIIVSAGNEENVFPESDLATESLSSENETDDGSSQEIAAE
ncbi:MAG: 16S rRNA (cytidine(1402)-2'-O)-methyltransferase [Rhizobacter sp.]|nr:16S rRNA (cytidine(1402)-2'-O)-methyltransferase [Chlorobiales bacterium]